MMDKSVDSIGSCSLNVNASVELPGLSLASSGETLRSVSLKTPSADLHLPSYLNLACTINGYSTITNYDPGRLTKSRDPSPHRNGNLTANTFPAYSIENNLLSPPNIVPLPLTYSKPKMSERSFTEKNLHKEIFSSSRTASETYYESHFTSNIFGKDSTDLCFENSSVTTKFESKFLSKSLNSSSESGDYTLETETKSFIQQRVERLYGPGALAQGFFVSKKQANGDTENSPLRNEKTRQNGESPSKQGSVNSPALPVLRHLRPEFRAQLPIISPRKLANNNCTKLKDEVNGSTAELKINADPVDSTVVKDSSDKDGHYFLKVLHNETERLLSLADKAENELTNEELSEDVVGIIRSASGKARLLVSQKMQQFKGLCANNIQQNEGEQFPTTNEDLQGFWDMVMLQVDQVDALFKEIEQMKANNWQEVKSENVSNKFKAMARPKKPMNRTRQTSAANEEARRQREAQRKQMLEERRRAMKSQSKPVNSIEIYVPEFS